MKITRFALAALWLTLLGANSNAQAPSTTTTVVTPAQPVPPVSTEVGVSSRDGITVSGTSVLVTRNGVTETLTKELELPNGVRVLPDGTILTRDGGKVSLRPSQVLSFEGKFINSPVLESVAPAGTSTTTTTTTSTAAPVITAPDTTVTRPMPPTTVVERAAVTPQAAADAAQIEARRRAEAMSNAPIKAGEGVQK
jgi:hypothetical protein